MVRIVFPRAEYQLITFAQQQNVISSVVLCDLEEPKIV
jgi:hypothetical protein